MATASLTSSTEELGEAIAALAVRLHAGTYELLVLLREFDDRITWDNGFASCAHWLHSTPTRTTRASGAPAWRTGIALGAAREKVRVAHALAILPLVSATMQRGAISCARADALGLLAEAALASDLDRGCAGDRYQVVLHMEAHTGVAAGDRLATTMELDHGALHVSAETSRRLSCDAAVVRMQHDADGAILDVGRKTRSVPPSIRRALQARDRSCRFLGCTARRCDAHHVEHWVDGGATRLENLVLLCRRHHRAVHEGGFELRQQGDGTMTFLRPNGAVLEVAPALPALFARLGEASWELDDIPVWDGTPLNLAYAIDVLYKRPDATGAAPPP